MVSAIKEGSSYLTSKSTLAISKGFKFKAPVVRIMVSTISKGGS